MIFRRQAFAATIRLAGVTTFLLAASALNSVATGAELRPAPVTPRHNPIADVQLGPNGHLLGKLVGQQSCGAAIRILHSGRDRTFHADRNGEFRIPGVQGGVYTIYALEKLTTFRAWTQGTAPPSAVDRLRLVTDRPRIRGQSPSPLGVSYGISSFMSTYPLLSYTALTAAIVIPMVEIAEKDDDPLPAS